MCAQLTPRLRRHEMWRATGLRYVIATIVLAIVTTQVNADLSLWIGDALAPDQHPLAIGETFEVGIANNSTDFYSGFIGIQDCTKGQWTSTLKAIAPLGEPSMTELDPGCLW